MNKNLHNTTGVHFVSSRIIESIPLPLLLPSLCVRTYPLGREVQREKGSEKGRKGERRRKGEGRRNKKGKKKKKKRINASSTCMLEQLYTRFVTLFREFFDSSSLTRDACKLSLKWPKLRSKFLLELLQTIIPQFAPLISPLLFPSSTRSSGFFLRGRESILNCTRTVFPFTRRFSETLKLAEFLKRTRKRGEITIVKEQWFDRGRETRVRNDRSVRSRAETRFPLKANLPTTENFPR